MSVALQSPFSGNKRLFEDSHVAEDQHSDAAAQQQQHAGGAKRARHLVAGSPAGRCGRPGSHYHAGVPASTVAAVKALFPGMDAKTVENVLAECGQDIDAAIQRLTQLKLGAEQQASANGSAAAANGSQQQQQAQQKQQQDASTPAAAGAAAADTAVPQTADQWVDALVQEMAAAKDFTDARGRAGKLLQAFEQFVTARNKDQAGGDGASASASAGGARLEEAVRENAILKRAVQIQNAKLQEVGAGKDQEVASLKQLLAQYQERMRHLELSNYSLALHLQKATDGQYQPANRPPDVF